MLIHEYLNLLVSMFVMCFVMRVLALGGGGGGGLTPTVTTQITPL